MPCLQHQIRDPFCDACDAVTNDPHTGWGGFRDHDLQMDFDNEQDRATFLATPAGRARAKSVARRREAAIDPREVD